MRVANLPTLPIVGASNGKAVWGPVVNRLPEVVRRELTKELRGDLRREVECELGPRDALFTHYIHHIHLSHYTHHTHHVHLMKPINGVHGMTTGVYDISYTISRVLLPLWSPSLNPVKCLWTDATMGSHHSPVGLRVSVCLVVAI